MKYTVIKEFNRLKEGLKPYKKGSTVEMEADEAYSFLRHGFIKEEKAQKVTKEAKKPAKRKTKSQSNGTSKGKGSKES